MSEPMSWNEIAEASGQMTQPSPNTASVEISENAKGEPRITVKLQRADGLASIADEVIEVYRAAKWALGSNLV